jgi:hypothetical protein
MLEAVVTLVFGVFRFTVRLRYQVHINYSVKFSAQSSMMNASDVQRNSDWAN